VPGAASYYQAREFHGFQVVFPPSLPYNKLKSEKICSFTIAAVFDKTCTSFIKGHGYLKIQKRAKAIRQKIRRLKKIIDPQHLVVGMAYHGKKITR